MSVDRLLDHFFANLIFLNIQKNQNIKTVVNKLDNIDNKFRVFKMELLAGEPNYVVEHVRIDSFTP